MRKAGVSRSHIPMLRIPDQQNQGPYILLETSGIKPARERVLGSRFPFLFQDRLTPPKARRMTHGSIDHAHVCQSLIGKRRFHFMFMKHRRLFHFSMLSRKRAIYE